MNTSVIVWGNLVFCGLYWPAAGLGSVRCRICFFHVLTAAMRSFMEPGWKMGADCFTKLESRIPNIESKIESIPKCYSLTGCWQAFNKLDKLHEHVHYHSLSLLPLRSTEEQQLMLARAEPGECEWASGQQERWWLTQQELNTNTSTLLRKIFKYVSSSIYRLLVRAYPRFLVFAHLQPSLHSHNTLLFSQPILMLFMTACTSVAAIKHHCLFQIVSISFTSYSPFSQAVFFIHYFEAQFSIFPSPHTLRPPPPAHINIQLISVNYTNAFFNFLALLYCLPMHSWWTWSR